MALRTPIRQPGTGVFGLGYADLDIEANPKAPANAGELLKLRIGPKDIFEVGGGDDVWDWALDGNTDVIPPEKLGSGSPGDTVFLRGDGQWAAPPGGGMGSATWLGLSDTPASWGTEGQYPAINAATNALEWATPLVTHFDGNGAPATAPAISGAVSVDNAGHVFPAITDHITHTTAPTMASETEAQFTPAVYWRGVNAVIGATSGNFTWFTASRQFVQRRGTANHPASWASAWQYIEGQDPTVDLRQSIFIGQHDTEAEALEAFNRNATAIARYTDGTTITEANSAYWIDASLNVLKRVTSYTASSTTVTEALHWGERLASLHDMVREHWRGEWEVNVSRAKAGDLWYVEREDFNMNVEKVVWLAVSDTSTAPTIGFDRFWINLTDTDHYRGEAFEHVLNNDVAIFFEHGDTFLYDDKLFFAFHESDLSINDILNETARYTDHFKVLTPDIPAAYTLTAQALDALIETPGPFGLSHVVNQSNDPNTLNIGLATDTIARLVDPMGTAGQVYTRTAGGHEWANLAVYDWAKTGDTSQIPVAKLGTGSPSSSNFLRGDGSWATVSTGASTFLGLSDSPSSWGAFWNIPAVNTSRDGLFWIAGPVGWAQRGDTQQIPLTKLGTGTATPTNFLRGDGSWAAVPAGLPTAGAEAQALVKDGATEGAARWGPWLYLPNASGDLPAPTPAVIGKAVGIKDDGLYHVEGKVYHATAPTGTWGDVGGSRLMLSTVKTNFFGTETNHNRSIADGQAVNTYMLDTSNRHFYEVYQASVSYKGLRYRDDPSDWLGFGTRDELLGRASAVGDWGYNTDSRKVEYLTAFTAGTGEHTEPIWARDAGDPPATWAVEGNPDQIPASKLPPTSVSNIVFPDAMGALRAGTADDWDAPNALSKVFAWTGNHLQRINRVPVPKSATFTPVPDGTNLGGTTNPRWRTFHHNDGQVSNPQNNDLYFNLTSNIFRFRQGGNWSNLSADHFAITGAGIVSGTVFADQATALDSSSLTANGQRIMYAEGGGHQLATVSDFVAAHNVYPWANVYAEWAQSENLSIIPQVKLGTGTATSSTFLRGDGQWEIPPTTSSGSGEPTAFVGASYTFSVPLSSGNIRFTRANGGTFDLAMLMPFVSAQSVRDGIVEPWATRGESDLIPLAKLDGPVTSLTNWTYDTSTRRQSLSVNRINEPNVTVQGPVFPEWITAAEVHDWAEASNSDRIPLAKLGSGTPANDNFLRGDGSWQTLPNSLVTNLVASWALVGDTSIIPTSKLPSFIVPVYDWAKAGNADVIPVGKLGSGATSTAVFLRGDGMWAQVTGGGMGTPVATTTETIKARRYGTTFEVSGSDLESNTSLSGAHGLGAEPDGWEAYLECTTPDKGYAVGDKVQWKPPPWRETVRFDATNTYVYTKNQGWGIINKGSTAGTSTNIDLSDWKLVVRPYIYEDKVVITGVTGGGGSGYDNFIELDDTPASWGTAGQFVAVNSSADGLVFVNAPSGGGSGDDAFDWATVGNTDTIPDAKIPGLGASKITSGTFATDRIPGLHANKITAGLFPPTRIAAGVASAGKIAQIHSATQNLEWVDKPITYPGDEHVQDITLGVISHAGSVTYAYDDAAGTATITGTGRTESEVNTQIEARRDFEWCSATVTATSTAVTIALDGEGTGSASTERILAINYISTFPATRPDSLPVFVSYNGQNSGNVQLFGANNARRNMTLGDLRVYGHTNVMHMFRRRSGGWDWVGTSGAASVAQDVASLIKPWALTANASTRVPVSQMGSGSASSTTWLRGDGSWQSLPALTDQQVANLVNGSPGNNRIIGYDTGDAGLRWYDLPTGGGGTGDDAFDWATVGNTDTIPDAKIPGLAASKTTSGVFDVARIPDLSAAKTTSGVFATARLGSGSPSSSNFLRGDGTWATPSGGGTSTPDLYKVGNSDISYSTSGSRRRVNLTISGGDNSVGTLVLFQWADATLTPASNEVEVGVNGSGYVRIKWDNPVGGSLENITLDDITRYNYYLLYRAGSFWHKIGGTVEALGSGGTGLTETQVRALIADWAEEGDLTNIPVAKLGNVHSWARAGNTDRLPEAKMTGYPTSFSLTAAGAQTFQWLMQRQGLTNLTAGSVLIPGLPSTITGSLSGTDLTISMTRTGTGGTINSSAIDLSGLGGGGGGLTAEQARDTIAAFATPGTGISITHDDPGDRLIFSADPHFEQVQTLVVFDHTGNAFRLNRDRPSDLFQVGTNVPGTSSGATYHRPDRRVYVVTGAGNIQRSDVNALSGWSNVGTLPSGRGAYNGLASDGTNMYALSEDGLTQVNLSNVGASASLGDWPTGLFGIGGAAFHLDVLHLVSASTRKIHVVSDLSSPGTAADRGRLPTGFVGVPHLLVAAGGRLYTLEAHTNGIELWEVNPLTPGSSTELGRVRDAGATITAGAAIDVRLDTTYIPEGDNLYYTDARWDDRFDDVVNPSGAATAFLEAASVDGTVHQVRNTFDIDNVGQLPTPGALTEGQFYFNKADRSIYVGIDEPHTQNTPSGTFNAISARSDLSVVTAFPADQNALTAGDFYYLHNQGWNDGFYVVAVRYGVNELVATTPTTALAASRTGNTQGVVWLGAENFASDALRFTYSVSSSSDYFWLDLSASPPTFKILDQSTFVAAGGTTHHYQFWRAGADAADWAQPGNSDRIPTSKLGSGTASSSTWLRGDGSWQSIPAGSPQILLDPDASPMASYWDATDSLSSRLKWTGFGFQRIKRELVGQHGASATFSEIANNTTFTQGGVTYRWRGAHQYDSNVSANVNDFFFKWSTGQMRVFRDGPNFSRDFWEDIDPRDIIPTYVDDYDSQTEARDHVGAVGQYVIYTTSGVDRLYRVTAYTAPSSGTPTYTWDDWVPWAGGLTEGDVLGLTQTWAHAGDTSAIPISKGGTGQTTAADALSALGGIGSVAHDNTLTGAGTPGDVLGVSVNDITETLQESIQHFTSGALNYSNKGASIGHRYGSGPYRTQISRVTVSIDAPNSGGTYVARIYTLQDNNRIDTHLANSNTRTLSHRRNEAFDFAAGSHTIPTNSRIGVLISRTDDGNGGDVRLRVGSEASSSPTESYDDASVDFNRIGWVEYEHTNPPANQSTHTHDTDGTADVYGDMRIQYRRIFDHGNFVGDGNVDASHIDSDGAANGTLLRADGSDGVAWGGAAVIDVDGTALTLDSRTYTGNHPALLVRVGSSGPRRVLEGWAGSSGGAWLSILGEVAGVDKPGIEIGEVGGTTRDVVWYRDAADVWRTPDAVHVGELRIDSGGLSDTQDNLGLVSWARSGNTGALPASKIPDLSANKITSGTFAAARLGSDVGTTPGSKVLYDDGSFKDAPSGGVGNLTFFSLTSDAAMGTSLANIVGGNHTAESTDELVGILVSASLVSGTTSSFATDMRLRAGTTSITPTLQLITFSGTLGSWRRQLFLHKPNSTSAVDYQLQARRRGNAKAARAGSSLTIFSMPDSAVADIITSNESVTANSDFLSVSITPSSASAKIKINVLVMLSSSILATVELTLRRGTTNLVSTQESILEGASAPGFPSNFEDWIDEPNTTSEVTYHVRSSAAFTAAVGSYLMAQEVG